MQQRPRFIYERVEWLDPSAHGRDIIGFAPVAVGARVARLFSGNWQTRSMGRSGAIPNSGSLSSDDTGYSCALGYQTLTFTAINGAPLNPHPRHRCVKTLEDTP